MIRWIMGLLTVFGLLLGYPFDGHAQRGKVEYLSSSSVYIDLGKKAGLAVGDTLLVQRLEKIIGRIVVKFAASNSASCSVIDQQTPISIGDQVILAARFRRKVRESEVTPPDTTLASPLPFRVSAPLRQPRRKDYAEIRGRVALQHLSLSDRSRTGLDFNQPSLYVRLKGERLFNGPVVLSLRLRSRNDRRQRALSSAAPAREWVHRVYQLYFLYHGDNSRYTFVVGRLLMNKISGIGTIDGGLFEWQLNENLRMGLFGGTQPDLHRSSWQSDRPKGGTYLYYSRGSYATSWYNGTLAVAGQYLKGTVDREFLYLQNNAGWGHKINLTQSVEVDLNRGWKSTDSGNSLQITNLFFALHYTPRRGISVNASYDARKNVRLVDTRAIPDSLFDDLLRQGLNFSLNLNLPHQFRLYGRAGLRYRTHDTQSTISYAAGLSSWNLMNTRTSLNLRLAFFDNVLATGFYPSASLGRYIHSRVRTEVSAGSYIHSVADNTVKSNWLRLNNDINLARNLYAALYYEYAWGDILKTNQIYGELGVRF